MRRKKRHTIDFPALRAAARAKPRGRGTQRDRGGPWLQWYTPNEFVSKRAHVAIGDLPVGLQGLRVLHLTDLHLGRRWGKAYDMLIGKVRDDPPDLILFTGDFVENRFDHRVGLPNVLRLFAGLKAKQGTYAILGNHDPDVMVPYLVEAGIRFVSDRRVLVPVAGGVVELIGFPGAARADLDRDFIRALPRREVGVPRIILSHYPDLFPAALELEPDLYLAGHTHGGQICLPNGWPPITHDRMPRRFCKGIHRIGRTWFAVNNGFGFTGVALRVFCSTEVVELVLVPA
jgi:predicted MPP superfamily phosphohydrolase